MTGSALLQRAAPHLAALAAMLAFSVNYVIGRWAYQDVPPVMLGFVRWAAAALLLATVVWPRIRAAAPLLRANWRIIVTCSIVMPFFGGTAAYFGLTMTTATNAGIFQTLTPIFTVVLAWVMLGEFLSARQIGGGIVAMAGVFYLVVKGDPARFAALNLNLGDIVLVLTNIAFAVYAILVRKLPRTIDPVALLFAICALGGLFHAPFLIAELAAGQMIVFTERAAASLVFVALFPSMVAILCFNYSVKQLGAGVATIYMYVVPVFTAGISVLVLREILELYHVIGALLVIGGVVLATLRARNRPAAQTARL
jgi:drug/metabolite transporter (DMT)-like permease